MGNEIAAVIIEPIPANNGLLIQRKPFLQHLRSLCSAHGALLIFDEVISGFRVGFEGAAGLYDVFPDIITFGKIIGGGLPVGAYAACKEIMEHVAPMGPVYQAGTLSGNPVAMAAGIAQLSACLEEGFYQRLQHNTTTMLETVRHHIHAKGYPVEIFSIGSIFWIAFTTSKRISRADQIDPAGMTYFRELHAWLLDNGIYLGPSGYEVGFVSAAHSEEDLTFTATLLNSGFDHIFNSQT
jgi:glutamate-1-semialdehyde 2,1-aminomutase